MAASSSTFEAKKHKDAQELIPVEEAVPVIHSGHGDPFKLMKEYLNDDICVTSSLYVHGKRLTIFGRDSADHLYKQAVAIARNLVLTAAPLDDLKAEVMKNPRVLLPIINITTHVDGQSLTLQGTLEQLAMIVLDRTIRTVSGFEDKGSAETLRKLREELLPDTMPQALEQTSFATFIEEDEVEKARKSVYLAKLNQAFDLIKENKPGAGDVIKNYIKTTQPAVIVNDGYFLNLLQLLCMAFEVLTDRGSELKDYLYGAQAKRYYCEVIGAAIEAPLPRRSRQVLVSGLYRLLYRDQIAVRIVDHDDFIFLGRPGSADQLGLNYFYDGTGCIDDVSVVMNWNVRGGRIFQDYFERLSQHSRLVSRSKIRSESKCLIM